MRAPGVVAPAGIRYAGTLPRFLAWVLDGIIIGLIVGVIGAVLSAFVANRVTASYINAILTLGLELLYFVGFWTSDAKATLGMRLFNLTIGNAADGRELEIGQALLRWVALGLPFQALSFLPAPLNALGALVTLWWLVLLITTIVSPTKQGLHDRIANSAIVQPIGREGPVLACLILLAILIVLPVVAIVGLIAIGTQVTSIVARPSTIAP